MFATETQSKMFGFFPLVIAAAFLAIYVQCSRTLEEQFDWIAVALIRGLVGTGVGILVAWPARDTFVFFHKKLLLKSTLLTVYLFGLFYAVLQISSANAVTIVSTVPVWIALLAIVLTGARFKPSFWLACLIVFIGMAFLLQAQTTSRIWVVFLLLGVTCLRGFTVILIRKMQEIPSSVIALHFSLVLTIISAVTFVLFGRRLDIANVFEPKNFILFFTIGTTATLCQTLVAVVAKSSGSVAAGMIGIVAAVFAFLIGIFLVDEPVHMWNLIGMALILFATGWILFHKPQPN